MAKQSVSDRTKRLAEGRCPVHGWPLTQASEWYVGRMGDAQTLVECPRCKAAIATESEPFGPATLLPDFVFLAEATVRPS